MLTTRSRTYEISAMVVHPDGQRAWTPLEPAGATERSAVSYAKERLKDEQNEHWVDVTLYHEGEFVRYIKR